MSHEAYRKTQKTTGNPRNAEYQVRAMTVGGTIASLTPGETALAGTISAKTTGLTRSWEYWSMRVAKMGGAVPAAKSAGPARAKPATAKRPLKSKAKKKPTARRR